MKCSALLLAAAGLAAAAPSNVPKFGRRNGGHSLPNLRNTKYPQYSSNWAGAVQIGTGYNRVTGTIIVPRATGGTNAAASAWVGIDGDTCQTAILQTGVSFYSDGSYDAWYEWIPDYSYSFSNFALSEGDQIRMTVDASSKTKGVATLENLTTGKSVSHTFTNPPSTLCETNAEWIVEDFQEGSSLVPFANFGTVTFTNATASGSSGTITPSGSTIIDIESSQGKILTDCSASSSGVTCRYTGS
ncbi:peptidase a4 family [Trichoderma cornu-damae]|uniref:Peptidase a4 family n=1 Tax=Trichoderma cornu-damae TaxID=654480 RepID=A0A9P8QTL2_9HYPO|nr:peptidase a4 family [Trichoderma cornu-damae]